MISYMRKSCISDPKKTGRPILSKSDNKYLMSEEKMEFVIIYIEFEGGKQRICATCKISARNVVNATLVCTLNARQYGMSDA